MTKFLMCLLAIPALALASPPIRMTEDPVDSDEGVFVSALQVRKTVVPMIRPIYVLNRYQNFETKMSIYYLSFIVQSKDGDVLCKHNDILQQKYFFCTKDYLAKIHYVQPDGTKNYVEVDIINFKPISTNKMPLN